MRREFRREGGLRCSITRNPRRRQTPGATNEATLAGAIAASNSSSSTYRQRTPPRFAIMVTPGDRRQRGPYAAAVAATACGTTGGATVTASQTNGGKGWFIQGRGGCDYRLRRRTGKRDLSSQRFVCHAHAWGHRRLDSRSSTCGLGGAYPIRL